MRSILSFFVCSVFLCSCGNSTPPAAPATKVAKGPASSKLSEADNKNLLTVLADYYSLKNALVATDGVKTTAASQQLLASATAMATSLQKDSVNNVAIKPYLDTIVTSCKAISVLTDKHCEEQRIPFSPLSNSMFAIIKIAGLKNAGVYQQYCPMAFNEKGAYWLSDESEIKNPYFGKKMLECGEVKDSIQ